MRVKGRGALCPLPLGPRVRSRVCCRAQKLFRYRREAQGTQRGQGRGQNIVNSRSSRSSGTQRAQAMRARVRARRRGRRTMTRMEARKRPPPSRQTQRSDRKGP
ncbi:hypothetical protein T492DRAFT_905572 [Pavlovales sp. CCMP2436]|nr:hypothetical protein T492DRAFT_905572 [Pavlovales sp. CCMP2436]